MKHKLHHYRRGNLLAYTSPVWAS